MAEFLIDLSDCVSDFHLASGSVEKEFSLLSHRQFNWKPDAAKWSVGECLEHLNLTGGKLIPYLESAIDRGHKKGKTGSPPFKAGSIGRWFIKGSGPKGRSIPTPKIYRPAVSDLDVRTVTMEFVHLQQEFVRLVEKSDGLDLSSIKARSPFTMFLRLSVAEWFKSTAGHQQRHLNQARRVMERDGFPKKH